jgi:hypothetical protein
VVQYRPECNWPDFHMSSIKCNQNLSTKNKTYIGITSPWCIPVIQFLWKEHVIDLFSFIYCKLRQSSNGYKCLPDEEYEEYTCFTKFEHRSK